MCETLAAVDGALLLSVYKCADGVLRDTNLSPVHFTDDMTKTHPPPAHIQTSITSAPKPVPQQTLKILHD